MYIGFEGTEVNKYERYFGVDLRVDSGVVIVEVLPNSPAADANLKTLDIITKVDDEKIETMTQLRKVLYKYRIGDKANLTIIRDGQEMKTEIVFTKF